MSDEYVVESDSVIEDHSATDEDVFFIEEIDVDPEISLLTMRC